MVLFTIVSIFGDHLVIIHACNDRESALEYMKTTAVKWACDNVGSNNYIDSFDTDKLPQRAGFYVQYKDPNLRTEILAKQVTETTLSGWRSTYKTYTTSIIGRYLIVETDANIALSTTVDRMAHELDTIINDYKSAEEDRVATMECYTKRIAQLESECMRTNISSDLFEGQIRGLKADLDSVRNENSSLHAKLSKCKCAVSPNESARTTIRRPVNSHALSFDGVVNELKTRFSLAQMAPRIPPPPPPPPTMPLVMPRLSPLLPMMAHSSTIDVPSTEYEPLPDSDDGGEEESASGSESDDSFPNTKSLDELLDELDDNMNKNGWS